MEPFALGIGASAGAGMASLAAFLAIRAEKKQLGEIVKELELFKEMFDVVDEAAAVFSQNGSLLYANKAMRDLVGLDEKPLSSFKPESLPYIRVKKEKIRLDEFLKSGIHYHKKENRLTIVPKSKLFVVGAREGYSVTLYAKRIEGTKEKTRYVVVIRDLRHQEEETTLTHAHQLTQLPNEIQAKKDLNKIFARTHLYDKRLAIVLIEIDNFSQIRAMVGHEQAEKQLIHIARYLEREAESKGAFVYHMFMNVFMVVMPKIDQLKEIDAFCRKVEHQLQNFYEIDNIKLHLSASMGIAVYPDCGSTFMLLDNAFKALYEAQKNGFGQYRFYHDIGDHSRFDEMELYNSLHKAIDDEEFEVYYQPIVRAADKEIVGAEALVRWRHPKYGAVPPTLFIPMLEKSGYIVELGRYVLETVLKQIKRWEMFKFKPIQVSVNMSLLELETDGFVENVEHKLKEHQVMPELIKFEITEGIAMQNEALIHGRLEMLKKLGVSIALDDFGTGYTSFSYLKKIPADLVKIDRSMVQNILRSLDDERIVHAMIELAHNLEMKVVVEGVEDEWMLEKLVGLGCDYLQGYYFGKPLPAFEFQKMIRFESTHTTSGTTKNSRRKRR